MTGTVTAAEPSGAGPPSPSRERSARSASRRRLWIVGIVVVGSLAFLLVRGLGNALVYFRTADEAVADRAQLANQDFRLEGVVVPGTVRQTRDGVDFNVESKGVTVAVANQGSPPSLFQSNLPVVVEGHFVGTGNTFSSDQIMVKHSAVYVAQHPGRVKAPNGSSR